MKSKIANYLFIFLFVFSLLGFSILSSIEEDESYSHAEKDQFFARNVTL